LIDIDDKIFVDGNELVVVEGDEGVDGRFVHVYDGSEFALVGVEYAVASKTLPGRKQFIFFAEVG
jgi:hypothetical protein